MRIGWACNHETANGYYRVLLPLGEMMRRGHTVIGPGDAAYRDAFTGAPSWDLMRVHQYATPENVELVRRLRAAGVAIVWDSDDDLASAPRSRTARRVIGSRRAIRRAHEQSLAMARAAHVVTTTSEPLAQSFRAAGAEHVTVIENHLERAQPPGRRRHHVGVVIGIVAAIEHGPDVDGLRIAETLQEIQRRHEHVSVVSFGIDLKLRERYIFARKVPFDQLLSRVRDFDVGLAPLIDSPFSRARSNVKLKEYSAAGVPWLASPVGPYAGMGEQQGGLLVDDGNWLEAIDELVRDPHRRAALAQKARAWAGTQTIERAGDAWEQIFRDAVARAGREAGDRPLSATRRRGT